MIKIRQRYLTKGESVHLNFTVNKHCFNVNDSVQNPKYFCIQSTYLKKLKKKYNKIIFS